MHEKEIIYFTEAFKLAGEKFYIDSIHKFQELVNDFPESDLADDAMYNIGLCYFEMNQFNKCVELIEEMIKKYPESTITALENSNEYGKTAAKGYYLIIQCFIALGDIQKAEKYVTILNNYTDSYIINNSKKYLFSTLAKKLIITYKEIN